MAEIERLTREREEEKGIVNSIWDLFGSPEYASLGGKSIYDLVSEAINGRNEAYAKGFAEARERAADYVCDGVEAAFISEQIRAMKPEERHD